MSRLMDDIDDEDRAYDLHKEMELEARAETLRWKLGTAADFGHQMTFPPAEDGEGWKASCTCGLGWRSSSRAAVAQSAITHAEEVAK